jgi:hypothetical protein
MLAASFGSEFRQLRSTVRRPRLLALLGREPEEPIRLERDGSGRRAGQAIMGERPAPMLPWITDDDRNLAVLVLH